MPTDLSKATQFDYLYDALANKYPSLAGDNQHTFFQFCTVPLAATWQTGNDAAAYDIANTVPATLDGFYTPGSSLLDNAYASLLRSIKPRDLNDNPDYQKLMIQVNDLESAQAKLIQTANAAYYTWLANNPGPNGTAAETKTEWLNDSMGGANYGNQF